MTLGLPAPELQFEGGTVLIVLGERRDDVLLLHESVLAASSERFRHRFGTSNWPPSREVEHPETGEKIKVFEYHLVEAEGSLCLSDEVPFSSSENFDRHRLTLCVEGSGRERYDSP